jgi:hypothetical protein
VQAQDFGNRGCRAMSCLEDRLWGVFELQFSISQL